MPILFAILCLFSCSPGSNDGTDTVSAFHLDSRGSVAPSGMSRGELAELERRGGFVSGIGFTEAGLSIAEDDAWGYVLAVYKELLYAKDSGMLADLEPELRSLRDGLEATKLSESGKQSAVKALEALTLMEEGKWSKAKALLPDSDPSEPDGMLAWLGALCAMREKREAKSIALYGSMQARYRTLPSYWFHAAVDEKRVELQRDAATRCVLLSPDGPMASEARVLLALSYGLSEADANSLILAQEAQIIVSQALAPGEADKLGKLLPLLALPDNPDTLFALGALKALAENAEILSWLLGQREKAEGRLAERLAYITG